MPLILLIACLGLQSPPAVQQPAASTTSPVVLPLARGVFSRYINAVGGRVAIWDLESFTANATLGIEGTEAEGKMDLAFRKPDLMRIRVDLGQMGTSEVGSDGEIAWEIVTTDDGTESEELIDLSDSRERRRTLNWFELAIRINADARVLKTIGPADFEGHACWEVQKINRAGLEERIFIDRNSYLLRGIRMIESSIGGEYEVTMSFRNWKPVKPLMLFHELAISAQEMELTVVFDSISLDKAAPDLFLPPQSIIDLVNEAVPTPPTTDQAP